VSEEEPTEEPTAGDDLLRQIWESPGDPSRLSVYADWLIERDDATRGEYIQLSLLPAPTPEQVARRDGIFRRNRARWLGAARFYVRTWADSVETPGFPSRVCCTPEQLAAGFALIRDLAPNITVVVEYSARLDEILPALPLGQLHGLALEGTNITDRLLSRLADKLDGIHRLELRPATWRLTAEGLAGVLERVPSLRELELDYDGTSDAHLRAIIESSHAARLTSLEIAEPFDPVLREVARLTFAGRALTFAPRKRY
jgi:uncharacterized protein (TIGR02996 family)